MAKDKEDKPASTRAQAVSAFTVPVTAAWLLAVAGIIGWGMPGQALIDNAGKVAAALGAGVAFLTVVLTAVQDIVSVRWKQRLLFPWGQTFGIPWEWKYDFPSHWAFSEWMMEKARLDDVAGCDALRISPEAQNERWGQYYQIYRDRMTVAHFSARHVAWREMVPVMLLLIVSTVIVGRLLGWQGRPTLWAYLLEACFALLAMSWLAARRSNEALVIAVLERVRDEGETPKADHRRQPSARPARLILYRYRHAPYLALF
jgi:hypothetical protein